MGKIGNFFKLPFTKAKTDAKNGLKTAFNFFMKSIGSTLFLPIKIILIVVLVIFVIILIYTDSQNKASEIIDNTCNTAINRLLDAFGESGENKEKTDFYKENGSLFFMNISEINDIYDEFMKEPDESITNRFNVVYGNNTVNDREYNENNVSSIDDRSKVDSEGRIVDENDKVPLLKHILLSEKYNFNNIEWKVYSHSSDGDAPEMVENPQLGVIYPKDSEDTELKSFVDLTFPYIQTWKIPFSFASAMIEKDNAQGNFGRFAYDILSYAQSDISVHRYDVQTLTKVSNYKEYERITRRTNLNLTLKKNVTTDPNTGVQTTTYSIVNGVVPENETISSEHINEKGTNNEVLVSENTEVDINYYVSKAKTFDISIENVYNYEKYSDADAAANQNYDMENEEKADYNETENEENKLVTSGLTGKVYNSLDSLLSATNASNYSIIYDSGDTIRVKFTGKTYVEKVGQDVTVTRVWSDKLNQESSTKAEYTYDDVTEYNENEDNLEYLETITKETFDSDPESKKYYERYAEDKELNLIDFINSNPKIYKHYIAEGEEYARFVGYSKLYLSDVYSILKDDLEKITDDNGNLPFIYGHSLGFVQSNSIVNSSDSIILNGNMQMLTCLKSRENPTIDEELKQQLLTELSASGGKGAELAAGDGWLYQYYKNYPSELMARVIAAEIDTVESSDEGIALVAAHALAMVNELNSRGEDATMYELLKSGYISFTTGSALQRFKEVPPQFYREICTAAIRGAFQEEGALPPGFTGDERYWIGTSDGFCSVANKNSYMEINGDKLETVGYKAYYGNSEGNRVGNSTTLHVFAKNGTTNGEMLEQSSTLNKPSYHSHSWYRFIDIKEQYRISGSGDTGMFANTAQTGQSMTASQITERMAKIREIMESMENLNGEVAEYPADPHAIGGYSLGGRVYPNLSQGSYGPEYQYGGENASSIGCIAIACAMLAAGFGDTSVTMDSLCGSGGEYRGIYLNVENIVNPVLAKHGLTTHIYGKHDGEYIKRLPNNFDRSIVEPEMDQALQNGYPIIMVAVRGKTGTFTNSTHYFLIVDVQVVDGQKQYYCLTEWPRTTGWHSAEVIFSDFGGVWIVGPQ